MRRFHATRTPSPPTQLAFAHRDTPAYNAKARDDRYPAASSPWYQRSDAHTREEAAMAKIRVYTTPTSGRHCGDGAKRKPDQGHCHTPGDRPGWGAWPQQRQHSS